MAWFLLVLVNRESKKNATFHSKNPERRVQKSYGYGEKEQEERGGAEYMLCGSEEIMDG